MASISKRMKKLRQEIDQKKVYSLQDAVSIIKKNANAKFDETVDVCIVLGIDTSKQDQAVRNVVNLPHGTGKSYRVAVFANDAKAEEAKAAGADIVGGEDLVQQIQSGNIQFDRCIATPDMMPLVGRVGKILGPKGLMPNPKLGTVTTDVVTAVTNAKGGQIEYRSEKGGIVHAGVGKVSFSEEAIAENVKTLYDAIVKSKPAVVKGTYIKRLYLSSTMGVSVMFTMDT